MKPQVIGFAGFARVGKDTCFQLAQDFMKGIPCNRLAFADPLKKDLEQCEKVLKEYVPHFDLNKPEFKEVYRDLWVSWGTRVARTLCPDIWPRRLAASIHEMLKRGWVIITDVRFPNEVQILRREFKATIFHVTRPGFGPAGREEAESFYDMLHQYPELRTDYNIDNDGTIADLREKLRTRILKEFNLEIPRGECSRCHQVVEGQQFVCSVCNKSICPACSVYVAPKKMFRCKDCTL